MHDAEFEISVSSNGSLLDEKRAALLDAGLQGIEINVSDEGGDYDEIYGLPFEKGDDNVVRFAQMAATSARFASSSSTIAVTPNTQDDAVQFATASIASCRTTS